MTKDGIKEGKIKGGAWQERWNNDRSLTCYERRIKLGIKEGEGGRWVDRCTYMW